jgi:hypothetical protein
VEVPRVKRAEREANAAHHFDPGDQRLQNANGPWADGPLTASAGDRAQPV